MKAHADEVAPLGGAGWEGGGKSFIHKGTNGRWRDALSAEDSRLYEDRARKELGEACARWMKEGGAA
jgi:aryl sulfotransferase